MSRKPLAERQVWFEPHGAWVDKPMFHNRYGSVPIAVKAILASLKARDEKAGKVKS